MKNRFAVLLLALFMLAACLVSPRQAQASQGSCVMPTAGTVSGLTLVQDINTCIAAIFSQNSGASAPANGPGAVANTYQWWIDTGNTALRIYDGANWLFVGYYDSVNHVWQAPIGGGAATVSSATTTDLCSSKANALTISGVTTINSFGSNCIVGTSKWLTFSGALTLTYSANLLLPNNGGNILTSAADKAWATYLGGGVWSVIFQHADGSALSASANFTSSVFFNSPGTVTVGVNTNDWNPTGLVNTNVIRLTCSSAINITGLTAPGTDGKFIVIDNVGATNNCTFTAQDAASSAANRFAFDRPMVVRPGRSFAVKYDLTAARWRSVVEVVSQPIASGFKNLKITNDPTNGTTLKNNMILTADELTVEDTNGGAVRLSSISCSADITASGAGGLDVGTVAQDTWYFFWIVYNPTTNTINCVHSLQTAAGSITKPSGYTFVGRFGANRTHATTAGCTFNSANSACFSRILQYGRRVQYVVTASSPTVALPNMANTSGGSVGTWSATAPVYATVTVSNYVPSTASMIGIAVTAKWNNGVNTDIQIAPNTGYAGFASTNPPPFSTMTSAGGVLEAGWIWLTLEGTTFAWVTDSTGGGVSALGWEDNL